MVFARFGRQIFQLYNKRPLLMNSVVGGCVYFGGEMVVELMGENEEGGDASRKRPAQEQSKPMHGMRGVSLHGSVDEWIDRWKEEAARLRERLDMKMCMELGALGAVENGAVMLTWYNFLARIVGSGNATQVVLLKCLLDQIFFATQQDGIFLAFCALNHTNELPEVVKELNNNFLTTWLNDCSLWPLFNFIGFAYVPLAFQPTYVSLIQFFWQIYISSVASSSANKSKNCNLNASNESINVVGEDTILSIFRQIDKDSNGYIDLNELQEAFKYKNVCLSKAELHEMVLNIKMTQNKLQKINFIKNSNNKNSNSDSNSNSNVEQVALSTKLPNPNPNPNPIPIPIPTTNNIDDIGVLISFEDFKYLYQYDRSKYGHIWSELVSSDSLKKGFKAIKKKIDNVKRREGKQFDEKERSEGIDYDHYYDTGSSKISAKELIRTAINSWDEASAAPKTEAWLKSRQDAKERVAIGCSALFVVAMIRKLVFKI